MPLKDKGDITITNAFRKNSDESKRKPNKIWVKKGSEFYNRSMKLFLKKNDIEIYLMDNEGNPVIGEKFIRNLKNKIYKFMTSISKNVYIDKLDDIANKYKNIYSTIKMKPVDVKSSTYIDFIKENNEEDPLIKKIVKKILNLKLVILLEYQNIKMFLQKVTLQIGLEKFYD